MSRSPLLVVVSGLALVACAGGPPPEEAEVGYGGSDGRVLWRTFTIDAGDDPGDVVRLASSSYRLDVD